jgi:hypothetical protein
MARSGRTIHGSARRSVANLWRIRASENTVRRTMVAQKLYFRPRLDGIPAAAHIA